MSISSAEMDRRWTAVRAVMAREGLDWLVGTSGHPFGYQRWLTNRVGMPGTLVAMPRSGDVLLASHGDAVHHFPVDSYGVRHLVTPAQPNQLANTHAPALVQAMHESAPRRIGVMGLGYLSAATYNTLLKSLPEVEFIDATEWIAPIKAIKSKEELGLMRKAARMHEEAVELLRDLVRPGKTAGEIMEEIRFFLNRNRSPAQTLMAGSSPPNVPCRYAGPKDRVLEPGDQFAMLIEAAEEDGYYSEAFPVVSLGPVPDTLRRAFDDAVEAQERLADMARPGADPNEMMRANDAFMLSRGYPAEGRLLGHSQGVDLVERPALTPGGETLKIEANMVISIHPTTHGPHAWGFPVNQSFLIGEGAPQRMLTTPQEIIVL
jgi:Xaa-Pro aminopeptidase